MFDFNQLTWFLYFADILTKIYLVLFWGSIVAGGVISFCYFIYTIGIESLPSFRLFFLVVIPSAFVLLLSCFIPSEDTMYRMAASEAGEMVVKDEYTQEVLDDLKEVIKYQLKSLKGE